MTCEACGRVLEDVEVVIDVAISITTAGEVQREEHEWNPEHEGYVCLACWNMTPEKVRRALR
jgi:hypothetical protein